MAKRVYHGSIWQTSDRVWFRCPYKGPREVTVLRQLSNGGVWIADMLVAGGKQKVHPSLLSSHRPDGLKG